MPHADQPDRIRDVDPGPNPAPPEPQATIETCEACGEGRWIGPTGYRHMANGDCPDCLAWLGGAGAARQHWR